MGAGEILATDGQDDRDIDEVIPGSAVLGAQARMPALPGLRSQVRRQAMASWQADVASAFIRMIMKRRPRGSEADVVKDIRSRLELPQFRRLLIKPVDSRAVIAVRDG